MPSLRRVHQLVRPVEPSQQGELPRLVPVDARQGPGIGRVAAQALHTGGHRRRIENRTAHEELGSGFDPATGKLLWSLGDDEVQYQSPIAATVGAAAIGGGSNAMGLFHPFLDDKDVNIIGNGPESLKRITMVANDARLDTGGWTCGKNGQSVPVSQGIPTVLVSKMTVGGENVG